MAYDQTAADTLRALDQLRYRVSTIADHAEAAAIELDPVPGYTAGLAERLLRTIAEGLRDSLTPKGGGAPASVVRVARVGGPDSPAPGSAGVGAGPGSPEAQSGSQPAGEVCPPDGSQLLVVTAERNAARSDLVSVTADRDALRRHVDRLARLARERRHELEVVGARAGWTGVLAAHLRFVVQAVEQAMAAAGQAGYPDRWRAVRSAAEQAAACLDALDDQPLPRPRIVALCGSTRFEQRFREVAATLTLDGAIVVKPDVFMNDGHPTKDHLPAVDPATKSFIDELHRRKIDLADEVLVLNVGGYIGSPDHRKEAGR